MEHKLTPIEIDMLIEEANKAWESGDLERGLAISKQLPMPESLKLAAIDVFGKDYLISNGFNLNSEQTNEWYYSRVHN